MVHYWIPYDTITTSLAYSHWFQNPLIQSQRKAIARNISQSTIVTQIGYKFLLFRCNDDIKDLFFYLATHFVPNTYDYY